VRDEQKVLKVSATSSSRLAKGMTLMFWVAVVEMVFIAMVMTKEMMMMMMMMMMMRVLGGRGIGGELDDDNDDDGGGYTR